MGYIIQSIRITWSFQKVPPDETRLTTPLGAEAVALISS